jgi:inorganic pyrophosphatase
MKYGDLPAFDAETGDLNVIVETPKGSRNKFSYDQETGLFTLSKLLPAGKVFPLNFGFIPSTRGGDGDPLDILLVFDEILFPGCLVTARLIGGLKVQQSEKGKMQRNDRLLAVPVLPREYDPPRSIRDLGKELVQDIEEFFVSYQKMMGKECKVLGIMAAKETEKLVRQSQKK